MTLPVRWELTRTNLDAGAATESETYAEDWSLLRHSQLGLYIASPRAQVPVYPFDTPDGLSQIPSQVVIREDHLCQLLGVPFDDESPMIPLLIFTLSPSHGIFPYTITTANQGKLNVSFRVQY
ncbi:hypothetical protein [Pseudobacteriovorax antillogorgiicola]|nr:hypothetical protein [Pseudobacteriovorax antillogorgiicola]